MSILINVLLVIHVLVSLLIVLLVLMQRPKNEGLGAAFGGGMTDNLFGAQTTNVLQTFTRYLGGMFFLLTLILSWLYMRQTSRSSDVQRNLLSAPAPAVAPAVPGTAADPNAAAIEAQPIATNPEAATAPVPAPGTAGEATPQPGTPATPGESPAAPGAPATPPAPENAAPAPDASTPGTPASNSPARASGTPTPAPNSEPQGQ